MFAPDRQGFFPGLWVQFLQDLPQHEKEIFNKLNNKRERFLWMYNRRFVKDRLELLRQMRLGSVKDQTESVKKREAGNQFFLAGDLQSAMVNYTRAVVLGEAGTTELASAYANRAACLQRLGCHDFALTDLDLAEQHGYQESNLFKLWDRRAQCLLSLKRPEEAKLAFDKAVKYSSLAKLDKKKKEKFLKDVNVGLKKIEDQQSTVVEEQNIPSEAGSQSDDILTVTSPHPQFPSASSSLQVRYQRGRGRYVEAGEDIPVGTTLLRESPITWALHPDRFGTHCQECLGQVKSVIPCDECTAVCFCSVTCRDTAVSSYHQYECGANNIIIASGLNIYPAITLRLLTRFGLDHVWSLRESLENHDDTAGADTDTLYTGDDFINAFNLVSHEDKMTEEEHLLRTFVSVFLLKLLQFNNYFGNFDEDETFQELSEKEEFIGTLLLHFSNSLPQNIHDIALLETSEVRRWVNSAEIKSLGAGVYLTAALFNHSCDPSFMRCNVGKSLVSVTNKNIGQGEEVSECYGQMYYSKSVETRQEQLRKHYKFDCECVACYYNYPTIKELKYACGGAVTKHQDLMRIRCSNCGQVLVRLKGVQVCHVLTCLVCGAETRVDSVPLDKIQELSTRAGTVLCDQLQWRPGIQAVLECQNLYDQHLVPPSLELYNSQISIWRALWMIVGNKKIKKSVI